jgi:hypothetical protein
MFKRRFWNEVDHKEDGSDSDSSDDESDIDPSKTPGTRRPLFKRKR